MYTKEHLNIGMHKFDFLHFVPFVLMTLCFLPFYISSSLRKIELILGDYRDANQVYFHLLEYINLLLPYQYLAYAILIFYLIRKEKSKPKNKSEEKQTRIIWMQILNGFFMLYVFMMIVYVIMIKLNVGGIEKDYYISLVMCFAIYMISYVAVINPAILKSNKFLEKLPKYKNSILGVDYMNEVIAKIEKSVIPNELYLKESIDLAEVSELLNLPKHHISQSINTILGNSFNDYINKKRIEKAKIYLQNLNESENIKTVMYACGYNNRVSFNNNFKKFEGMTPSQYVDSL